MLGFVKRYYGFLIILLLITLWVVNSEADKQTAECGYWIIWTQEMNKARVWDLDFRLQVLSDARERMREHQHSVASEYRDIFDWGWFPPKEIRLQKDLFLELNRKE